MLIEGPFSYAMPDLPSRDLNSVTLRRGPSDSMMLRAKNQANSTT